MLRRLALGAVLLAVLIVGSSAFLRLSQDGLSCADWPACYGTPPREPSPLVDEVRLLHRVAAGAVGICIVLLAVFGWDHWRGDLRRALSIALLALTLALAWLGRYTPSPIPAVALGNLLGGALLFSLLFTMCKALGHVREQAAVQRALCAWTWIALVAVVLQVALGGLISVRHAALACDGTLGCGVWPGDWSAFDPFRANEDLDEASRQTLQLAHRYGGALTALLLLWTGWRQLRGGQRGQGAALLSFTGLQFVLGAALPASGHPIVLVVAHNGMAAAILAVLLDAALRLRREASR